MLKLSMCRLFRISHVFAIYIRGWMKGLLPVKIEPEDLEYHQRMDGRVKIEIEDLEYHHRMDERLFPVKIEPKADSECRHQEMKLEMETDVDLKIKAEFKECLQQQGSQQLLLLFPPIKEELHELVDSDNSRHTIIVKSKCVILHEKDRNIKIEGFSYNKNFDESKAGSFTKQSQGVVHCGKHGGNRDKCKEECCATQARRGGICMKNGGTRARCKEECYTKQARRGGFCTENGGVLKKKVVSN